MRSIQEIIILSFVNLMVFSIASATEIEVDPTSKTSPGSIQEALDRALPGDTIVVPPGDYFENLTMAGAVTLISKSGPRATTIYGNGNICINCEGCGPGTRISGFTITGGGSFAGGGIRVFGESSVEIDHNIVRNNRTEFEAAGVLVQRNSWADIHDNAFIENESFKTAALSVIVNSTATIHRNLFHSNRSSVFAGAVGVNEAMVRIFHNVFLDNLSGGIGGTIDITGSQATISNNSFLQNRSDEGGTCVSLNTGSYSCAIVNNLAAYNFGPTVVSFGGCQNISCNIYWENSENYVGDCRPPASAGNVETDPLLCDPSNYLAEVADNSPCLSSTCGVIGANPSPGCAAIALKNLPPEETSWGSLKAIFR